MLHFFLNYTVLHDSTLYAVVKSAEPLTLYSASIRAAISGTDRFKLFILEWFVD